MSAVRVTMVSRTASWLGKVASRVHPSLVTDVDSPSRRSTSPAVLLPDSSLHR